MRFHCLFEQSGTFKNEAKKLGYEAYDYDIQNEFGETDFQIDLFKQIRGGYEGQPSIFDEMKPDDLVLAFFPCVRFETQIQMGFRGELSQMKDWSDETKLEYGMKLEAERTEMYDLITKLAIIALRKKFPLVLENPYSSDHFLKQYWALKPKVIDLDRTQNGDYYKKPTQYWFINREPKQNLVFEPLDYAPMQVVHKVKKQNDISVKTQRSMIHPQYASRFIRQYLIEDTGGFNGKAVL